MGFLGIMLVLRNLVVSIHKSLASPPVSLAPVPERRATVYPFCFVLGHTPTSQAPFKRRVSHESAHARVANQC